MAIRNEHDPDETVVVVVVPTELEGNLIVDALSERGIRAEATGGVTAGFRAEAPGGVRVIVRRADAEAAIAAVRAFKQDRDDIDWTRVDIGSPE